MSTSPQAWRPAGSQLTQNQRNVLAVPARLKPSPDVYPYLLAEKIQALIQADPLDARNAIGILPEGLEMEARGESMDQWPQALIHSDSMANLLSQIDWSQPGLLQPLPPTSLRELLEQMP